MYRQRSHLGGDKGFDSHRSGGCERAADTVILFKSVRANLPIHVAPSYFISTSSSRSAATSRSLFGSLWFFVIHIPFAVCSIFWNMLAPVYELELFCNRILSKPYQKKSYIGEISWLLRSMFLSVKYILLYANQKKFVACVWYLNRWWVKDKQCNIDIKMLLHLLMEATYGQIVTCLFYHLFNKFIHHMCVCVRARNKPLPF